ncbi:MAG: UDP-N-acetylmuramoyl-L-alanyl-D-glutamate--2,6-diaminopimelate ligase [Clostridia bacterium]|nr:UDP-N-acetylmuramoyl-L-alanyl-D-glutamate--2,6-diaminopimelate ligase [Clostridia bacterium]
MTLQEIMQGIVTNSDLSAVHSLNVEKLCFDSRKVVPGTLFFCIRGETTDGHLYAQKAASAGAVAIVAEHQTEADLPHILVENSRKALFYACANFFDHPEKDLKFIGVTGTNGKTSTTFFIKELLDAMGIQSGLLGTVKNMIGQQVLPSGFTTPEPLQLFEIFAQMRQAGVKYVVMEISSHALCQDRVAGLTFEVGVFTNLTQDHLDFHKTMEAYKEAKFNLFRQSKVSVFNVDDATGKEFAERSCEGKHYVTYSAAQNDADFVARDIALHSDGVSFFLVTHGNLCRAKVSTPGKFTVYNATAAVAALYSAGLPFGEITSHLSQLKNVDGRAQIVPTGKDFTVMLDYAHTPDALENILRTVRSYATGRVVTLFGCGGDRDRTKRPLMGEMATKYSDFVIVTSDNPRTEQPAAIIADILPGVEQGSTPYIVIENRKEAIGYAISHAKKDDIILLAGKGHEKYQILSTGKIDFDEEQIVGEFIRDLK